MSDDHNQGWSRWENYVIEKLKGLDAKHDALYRELQSIHVEIALLKLKSGVWGAAGAAIPVTGFILFELLTRK